jgi:hypothetical protein
MASGVTMVGAEVWAIVGGHRSFPNDGHAAPRWSALPSVLAWRDCSEPLGLRNAESSAVTHPWGGLHREGFGCPSPAIGGAPRPGFGDVRSGACSVRPARGATRVPRRSVTLPRGSTPRPGVGCRPDSPPLPYAAALAYAVESVLWARRRCSWVLIQRRTSCSTSSVVRPASTTVSFQSPSVAEQERLLGNATLPVDHMCDAPGDAEDSATVGANVEERVGDNAPTAPPMDREASSVGVV